MGRVNLAQKRMPKGEIVIKVLVPVADIPKDEEFSVTVVKEAEKVADTVKVEVTR